MVKKCSLNGAKHILVDERIYCANKNGIMNQSRAIEYCEKLNATLPFPLSSLELEVFSNLTSPDKTWIGIKDPLNVGKKAKWGKAGLYGDGTAAFYNETGIFDTNKTENYTVVCVQNVACKYLHVCYFNTTTS